MFLLYLRVDNKEQHRINTFDQLKAQFFIS